MQRSFLLLFFLMATSSTTGAQPTNMETFQALAVECMGFISDVKEGLIIDTPGQMPYVRSAIVTRLNQRGRQVFLADSVYTNQPANLSTLSYKIDAASVVYERLRKKKARRTVHFSATTMLVSAQGALINDEVCNEHFTDTLSVAALPSLESGSFSETQAPPLKAGFFRRIFQPVMLTTATALTVYLFFTLRSESSNDGN